MSHLEDLCVVGFSGSWESILTDDEEIPLPLSMCLVV